MRSSRVVDYLDWRGVTSKNDAGRACIRLTVGAAACWNQRQQFGQHIALAAEPLKRRAQALLSPPVHDAWYTFVCIQISRTIVVGATQCCKTLLL
ncbi:MAG: hypothetical protein KatS3mg038_1123 [Candidatus Kapaibacterium sp.]|nr:MAG: hypothetical protein KatS3mg038_1123 [Candidatus Kapabacteria bacterium]